MLPRILAAALSIALLACTDEPSVPPPIPVPTHLATVEVAGWTFDVPPGWVTEEPVSRSALFPRYLQIRLPGEEGTGHAQLIAVKTIGTPEANVERWKGTFQATDADRARWREETIEIGGVTCPLVELHGVHTVPMTSREEGQDYVLPGHALLATVWTPDSAIAFRALGPAASIERHRDAFRAFLTSARH